MPKRGGERLQVPTPTHQRWAVPEKFSLAFHPYVSTAASPNLGKAAKRVSESLVSLQPASSSLAWA